MFAWNPKEFNKLCKQAGLKGASVYIGSLVVKKWAAYYHKENFQKKLSELKKKGLGFAPLRTLQYEKEIAFEIDALMVTLNSIWDILAQLINECFAKIDSNEVSFNKFANPKEYCHKLIPSEIQPLLISIRSNTLYRTINCYANVSKHKYLPSGDIYMDVSAKPRKVSYVISQFNYKKGEWHDLSDDKALKCYDFMIKSINQILAKTYVLIKV
jgi:hypothetical protein